MTQPSITEQLNLRPGQSLELLKELHILTREGKLNQDSRRKLKQVYHLTQFIAPLIEQSLQKRGALNLVDHGAGKSYLGFMLYDLYLKDTPAQVYGIETRAELVEKSRALAERLGFKGMSFLHLAAAEAATSPELPETIDIVTALHACNTATDDALDFALQKRAQSIVIVPCCQAEVATCLNQHKQQKLHDPLTETWRHPHHTREFGSHITNVLRCLRLEAHGYQVTVTELVGWEHAMKNELIIAQHKNLPRQRATERLQNLIGTMGLRDLEQRFRMIEG